MSVGRRRDLENYPSVCSQMGFIRKFRVDLGLRNSKAYNESRLPEALRAKYCPRAHFFAKNGPKMNEKCIAFFPGKFVWTQITHKQTSLRSPLLFFVSQAYPSLLLLISLLFILSVIYEISFLLLSIFINLVGGFSKLFFIFIFYILYLLIFSFYSLK